MKIKELYYSREVSCYVFASTQYAFAVHKHILFQEHVKIERYGMIDIIGLKISLMVYQKNEKLMHYNDSEIGACNAIKCQILRGYFEFYKTGFLEKNKKKALKKLLSCLAFSTLLIGCYERYLQFMSNLEIRSLFGKHLPDITLVGTYRLILGSYKPFLRNSTKSSFSFIDKLSGRNASEI